MTGEGNGDPAGSGAATFTQEQVNTIVQKRLTEDRDRRRKEGLTDSDRDRLETQVETLNRELSSVREELKGAKSKFDDEAKTHKDLQRAHKATLINRAIGAAASKLGAVDPSVVETLIKDRTRIREITNDGKPTGEFVVEIRVDVDREGKKETVWAEAETGVKDLLDKSPYLVKSPVPQGTGSPPAKTPAGSPAEGQLPKGVQPKMPGVGHLPKGGATSGTISDLFESAGSKLEERLRQGAGS